MRSRLLVRQLPIVRRLVLALLLGLLFAGKSAAEPLPGQIVADESGYLKRHQGRHVFICGPGDPEGFLYRGNLQADQTRDGDQVQLIRRLLEYGGNCLYLQAVRSHGGDGTADHNPFREHDPSQGIQPAVLEQWESWFQLLDEHGMLIYFFFYDDSSDPWRTGDDVSEQEAAFVRQIVQRFQHHRHLIWVVAEESEEALSPVRAQKLARLIRATDEHQHLIGNHHHSGTDFKAYQPETAFDHYAMQLNYAAEDVYRQTRTACDQAAGKYQLIYAENTTTPQTVDAWRRQAWTVSMAGAMPMLLGMDVVSTPDAALRQCRILSEFFEDTDYFRMHPVTPTTESSPYLLRQGNQSLIAWSPSMDRVEVEWEVGRYELTWLDCVTGRRVDGEVRVEEQQRPVLLRKPPSIGPECAVYGRRAREVTLDSRVVFPRETWDVRTPRQVRLDDKKVKAFQKLAGGRGCIIKDGFLVSSWGDIKRRGDLASASKPIYAHLLLRALEEGRLESVDDPVATYRPCLMEINPQLGHKDRQLSFRHLAFQTACLGYTEVPGNAYDYNDHTMGLFWDVVVNDVWETTWDQAHQLMARELGMPLQFQDGISFPTEGRTRGRPSLSPRDFARFGWLYLNRGRWHDCQLLSARHVDRVSRDALPLQIPRTRASAADRCATRSIGGGGNQADHNGGYSWLWWVNEQARDGKRWWTGAPPGMFCALGHCGRRGIAILPAQRMVVSWNDAEELHCNRELGSQAFQLLADAAEPTVTSPPQNSPEARP